MEQTGLHGGRAGSEGQEGAGGGPGGRGGARRLISGPPGVPALPGSGVFLEPPTIATRPRGSAEGDAADRFPGTFQEKRAGPGAPANHRRREAGLGVRPDQSRLEGGRAG